MNTNKTNNPINNLLIYDGDAYYYDKKYPIVLLLL